jgi:hypothetical protein
MSLNLVSKTTIKLSHFTALPKAVFLKLFSSGDHFYQSEYSTDHPTVVPFERKLRFSTTVCKKQFKLVLFFLPFLE